MRHDRLNKRSPRMTAMSGMLIVALAGALLTGCGSGSKTAGASGTTAAPPGDGTTAATAAPATRTPVLLGAIYQGAGTIAADPEVGPALTAAVDYINNSLGGVGGHPLKLTTCISDGTPGSSQTCAEQMVAAKPTMVIVPVDYNITAIDSTLASAHIYALDITPISPADYAATGVGFITCGNLCGGLSGALGLLAQYPNAKKVGFFGPDIAPLAPLIQIDKSILAAHGVTMTTVQFPTSDTDLTGPWAELGHEDAILTALPSQYCVPAMKAAQAEGNTAPVFAQALCSSPEIAAQAGGAGNGWIVASNAPDPLGSTPQAVLYQTEMKKYAGANANLGGFADFGFLNVMQAYLALLKPLGYDQLTTANIERQAQQASPLFLGSPGSTFQCGQQPKMPPLCTVTFVLGVIHGNTYTVIPGANGQINFASTLLSILKL
jgi:branched-chain amino acid transport system substrate-binding protein